MILVVSPPNKIEKFDRGLIIIVIKVTEENKVNLVYLVVDSCQMSQIGVVWENVSRSFDCLEGLHGGQVFVEDEVGDDAARGAGESGKAVHHNPSRVLQSVIGINST